MKNIFLIICCFLVIFTGCFNVEARKEYETYCYYSSPVPLPYFSTVQRAPYYDTEFFNRNAKIIMLNISNESMYKKRKRVKVLMGDGNEIKH